MRHEERHATHRLGWLRVAVPGVNDGIVSTASLVPGMAAGRTPAMTAAIPVTFRDAPAMALTTGVGSWFGLVS